MGRFSPQLATASATAREVDVAINAYTPLDPSRANEALTTANAKAASPGSVTTQSADANAAIAASEQQLAADLNNPQSTAQDLISDLKSLGSAFTQAGRGGELGDAIAASMPAGTGGSDAAALFAMAAALGVDPSASKDRVSDGKAAKVTAEGHHHHHHKKPADGSDSPSAAAQTAPSAGNAAGNAEPQNGSPPASQSAANAAPPPTVSQSNQTTNDKSSQGGQPINYSGPASNFPLDSSKWASWNDSWNKAASAMASGTQNTPAQTAAIKDAITSEAQKTGLDPRYILAVVMQESGGNVHVQTTNNGVNNPGLMQSHNGASFSDQGDGGRASIFQMIKDGVEGTASGDGLVQGVQQQGDIFSAARAYNSGSVNKSNLSDPMGATASYASDIANRLMGRM